MDCEICKEEGEPTTAASTWRYIEDGDTELAVCERCASVIDDNERDAAKKLREQEEQDAYDHAVGMAEDRTMRQMERSLDAAQNAFLNRHYLGDRS